MKISLYVKILFPIKLASKNKTNISTIGSYSATNAPVSMPSLLRCCTSHLLHRIVCSGLLSTQPLQLLFDFISFLLLLCLPLLLLCASSV